MTGLVEKLIAGSKPAFEALYQQYHRKVYFFVSKQTSHVAQVEDLVHDIFIKLWENRAGLSPEIPIEAQLFVIARQVTINYYKREVLKQKVYDNLAIEKEKTASEDEESTSNEILTQLNTAIEALPPKRRQIFKMSKMEGLTYEEIAEALAISKSTVESQMVKALKFLRKRTTQLPFF
jgi:RNA polymerase sigma-70 factor (family 1)